MCLVPLRIRTNDRKLSRHQPTAPPRQIAEQRWNSSQRFRNVTKSDPILERLVALRSTDFPPVQRAVARSWIDSAEAMTRTSARHPRPPLPAPCPIRGSTGSVERRCPIGVRTPRSSIAPSSWSVSYPSLRRRDSGGSTNGNRSGSPRRRAFICRIAPARFVLRISGSVNAGRWAKSSSAYSRIAIPGPSRPHRPARWQRPG